MGAELGDERLQRRLLLIAAAADGSPALSFPRMTGSDGELEGVYRFLSNDRVTPDKILRPHFDATRVRTGGEPDALVVHDSTTFRFGGVSRREGLGWIHKTDGSQGFIGHFALAITADGTRRPLGLMGLSTIVREGTPLGRNCNARKRMQRPDRESKRWLELALAVHESLPRAVHVMDREGDSFSLLESLMAVEASFVIRARTGNGRIVVENGLRVPVSDLAQQRPLKLRRTVALSRRRRGPGLGKLNTSHPERCERLAKLEIRAGSVSLPRPKHEKISIEPRQLQINVVWVIEQNPPEHVDPVSWVILTNLPVETRQDIERVVDAYRGRWTIEEFFKVLKTGCAFERRQLESFHALMNALAIFSVIAWRLLVLRSAAHEDPGGPATRALTRRQIEVLSAITQLNDPRLRRAALPNQPTNRDALFAVAGLGGHLRNNGVPGWQTLSHGYEALLMLELGWRARDQM
jgi:hypothetical protein